MFLFLNFSTVIRIFLEAKPESTKILNSTFSISVDYCFTFCQSEAITNV